VLTISTWFGQIIFDGMIEDFDFFSFGWDITVTFIGKSSYGNPDVSITGHMQM
jgi:hypothetical protein